MSTPDVTIRTFTRADRDQITHLANAHAAAVIPGVSVSVAHLLGTMERDPGEFFDDPWVTERITLVAQQRERVVAAAHLQRYSDSPDAPDGLRAIAGIRWITCWPETTFWPDSTMAGAALIDACLAVLHNWEPRVVFADGSLPVPGVYGIPDQWPHLRSLLGAAGFVSRGRSERVLMALVRDLPSLRSERGPRGMSIHRTLGHVGTRLTAVGPDGRDLGLIELDTNLEATSQRSRHEGMADIGNLHLEQGHVKTLGPWLMAQARSWLELAGVTRVLGYIMVNEDAAEQAQQKFLQENGFQVLTTTVRDLTLPH